ncbi:hypothetical protein [Novosphingobium decolorationis]|uniref:Uncharacterized protein n=1 Tax=Novosphingobium decolorationis TaxID=2698673 RepID=A0ABX8E889_9SPHN|nr:hypothetical protein [Novosphingobium decolorationis]QVM85397.1 hypothetical protein HT578_18365 [Novosphingobium decolorationis]
MILIVTGLFVSFLALFVVASLLEHLVFKHLLRRATTIKLLSTLGAWLIGGVTIAGSAGEMQSDLDAGFLGTMLVGLLALTLPAGILAVIGYLGARQRAKANLPEDIEKTFS